MLKRKIIKRLAPYQYPQVLFGREIMNSLNRSAIQPHSILDCPCGNGEVSYRLSALEQSAVIGVDINAKSIEMASTNFKSPNLEFKVADIFSFLSEKKQYDLICVVNSLFLLPDHENLFKLLHARLNGSKARLMIITPNPEGENFKRFQEQHPGVNKIVFGKHEMTTRAAELQFAVKEITELEYAGYYGRKELRYLSVLAPFYLLSLNFFKSSSGEKRGNYILYCLEKL